MCIQLTHDFFIERGKYNVHSIVLLNEVSSMSDRGKIFYFRNTVT